MENFSINEVPYESLALIGMNKKSVLNLDKDNLLRFLSGQRTDILRFDFYAAGKKIVMDGKLLLERKNGEVKAFVVPVRKQIQNDYNLTNAELVQLYSGKLINKNVDGQRNLLQLDRETNEIIKSKTKGINIPFDIPSAEREKLLQGKSVTIESEIGKHKIRLDLLNERGFSLDGERQHIRYVGSYFTETDLKMVDIDKFNIREYDKQRLLDGYKTGLIEMPDGTKAKLAIERNEDRTVSIQVFPVKNEINNDIHLDKELIEKMKKGETVTAEINGKKFLCQLDKETNDLLSRQMENVVPNQIRGIELKKSDKERLINGQSVSLINNLTGEAITAKIDLNHKQGIEIKDDVFKLRALFSSGEKANNVLKTQLPNKLQQDKFIARNNLDIKDLSNTARAAFDEKQKFDFDYHNPGFMAYIQTDENRAEYMSFIQQKMPGASIKM